MRPRKNSVSQVIQNRHKEEQKPIIYQKTDKNWVFNKTATWLPHGQLFTNTVHYSRRQFSPTDVSNCVSTRRSRGALQWQIITTDLCMYQWNIKHNINKYQWNNFPDIAERLICKNILKGKKEISRRWDISERSS